MPATWKPRARAVKARPDTLNQYSGNAASTVFAVPELLDTILVAADLDMRALVRLRAVHSDWRTTIAQGSVELRQKVFLAPVAEKTYLLVKDIERGWQVAESKIASRTSSEPGYRLVGIVGILHPALWKLKRGSPYPLHSSTIRISDDKFTRWYLRLPGTVKHWKDMFVTQPPAVKLTLDTAVGPSRTAAITVVERSAGIRIRDVFRALQRLKSKHGGFKATVPFEKISFQEMEVYGDMKSALEQTTW
ncbi:hypothetical protein TI39_contig4195g00022 [Zymoseptoria brevis]|uniref:Uncharacterized protein n=1 Tax=Zymoseptoria brevis TaxID=1047168 RepID=A0A0F4GAS9_9PEZI|nr:hypothetical protein TI39_contig4195g00022 [Zymoseptoria brevis]